MATYRCGQAVDEVVRALLPQVDHLIVVDNGSDASTLDVLDRLARRHPSIHLILNGRNRGLACAQNQGIRQALALGYPWILLVDHDSIATPGMVDRMLEAQTATKGSKIAMLVPNIVFRCGTGSYRYLHPHSRFGFRRRTLTEGTPSEDVLVAISSGSLIAASVFRCVGLMDEGYFVDYVDIEFCFRLQSAGYTIRAVPDAHLRHQLGASRQATGLPAGVRVTHHSPFRRYLMFRNRLITWRRYGQQWPGWAAFDVCAGLIELIKILLFERSRTAKLRAVASGLWAGVRAQAPAPSPRPDIEGPLSPQEPCGGSTRAPRGGAGDPSSDSEQRGVASVATAHQSSGSTRSHLQLAARPQSPRGRLNGH